MISNRGWIISKTVTVSTKKDQSSDYEQFNYDPVVGVYTISVASELISMHPNTLRKYDKNGKRFRRRSSRSCQCSILWLGFKK